MDVNWKRYTKLPVVIEACKWTGSNVSEIETFTSYDRININLTMAGSLSINTLEGVMTASVGDYIIKGVQGEFYPCKPDIFDMTYSEFIDTKV